MRLTATQNSALVTDSTFSTCETLPSALDLENNNPSVLESDCSWIQGCCLTADFFCLGFTKLLFSHKKLVVLSTGLTDQRWSFLLVHYSIYSNAIEIRIHTS